jgi:hypothetical protein
MGTTHAAMGLALGAATLAVAPEFAVVAAIAGVAGGFFPDLDLLAGVHRRTLHFPVYYWVLAVPAVALAAVVPQAGTVAAAVFLLAAAVHSAVDVLGAGTELRPWKATVDRAVYVHPRGGWLDARRLIRYDGAPEDLLLTIGFAVPGIVLFDPPVRWLAIGLIILGTGYALVRKQVPDAAEWVVERLPVPEWVRTRILDSH